MKDVGNLSVAFVKVRGLQFSYPFWYSSHNTETVHCCIFLAARRSWFEGSPPILRERICAALAAVMLSRLLRPATSSTCFKLPSSRAGCDNECNKFAHCRDHDKSRRGIWFSAASFLEEIFLPQFPQKRPLLDGSSFPQNGQKLISDLL